MEKISSKGREEDNIGSLGVDEYGCFSLLYDGLNQKVSPSLNQSLEKFLKIFYIRISSLGETYFLPKDNPSGISSGIRWAIYYFLVSKSLIFKDISYSRFISSHRDLWCVCG